MKRFAAVLRLAPLLFLPLLVACTTTPDTATLEAGAEKRVLAAHDSLMARMDQLYSRRQALQKAGLDTAVATSHQRQLLAAEAAMMDWMHQYHRPADTVAHPRKMAFYAQQQQKIDSVAQLMRRSLQAADALLSPATTSPTTSKP